MYLLPQERYQWNSEEFRENIVECNIERRAGCGIARKALPHLECQLTKLSDVATDEELNIILMERFKCLLQVFSYHILTWISRANAGGSIIKRNFHECISHCVDCFKS